MVDMMTLERGDGCFSICIGVSFSSFSCPSLMVSVP